MYNEVTKTYPYDFAKYIWRMFVSNMRVPCKLCIAHCGHQSSKHWFTSGVRVYNAFGFCCFQWCYSYPEMVNIGKYQRKSLQAQMLTLSANGPLQIHNNSIVMLHVHYLCNYNAANIRERTWYRTVFPDGVILQLNVWGITDMVYCIQLTDLNLHASIRSRSVLMESHDLG